MKKQIIVFLLMLYSMLGAQSFYDINRIQKIEIKFTQSNWDYMLDTAKAGSDGYIIALWVKVNGVQFDSVGVKYKGNSSYNPNQFKNPFHIELDHVKSDQEYDGFTDIKLSNGFKDPSFVREVLSYHIARTYMSAPLSNYATVYVNGQQIGLYSNSESISKKFVNKHFYSKQNTFVKCNPSGMGTKSNLFYRGSDSSLYYTSYELKSDYGWKDLIMLCDSLANNINGIENILDVDRALWMLAFDNVLVNIDSYLGVFAQNYYLYRGNNGRFNSVVWDLNESFGGFTNTGVGQPLTIPQMQSLSPNLHINDAQWPLVQKLLAVPIFYRMYIAHMRTITNEYFSNGIYLTMAQNLQSIIDTAVQSDPNKFFTYTQFKNNLNNNITQGPQTIPGLSTLMSSRATYLQNTIEFQRVPPSISNIIPSNSSPNINTNVFITANVTNANNVYLGHRYAVADRFKRILMYDDGQHGDGASGDGVYGVSIPVSSNFIQYYIYADNNNAGMFSPQRSEHEYYTLNATITTISRGEVTINEFMALNNTTVTDPSGQYDDWIELYNNTNANISLENLFLSDSYTSPLKWQFPDNTIIPPDGYLIIWADEDLSQPGLHANFKLSGNGEKVILSYANGIIIDSVTFPAQTVDISYGRYPNGTGPFTFLNPTFNAQNQLLTNVNEPNENPVEFKLSQNFPNPFNNTSIINYQLPIDSRVTLKMYCIAGQEVATVVNEFKKAGRYEIEFNASNLSSGVYYYRLVAGEYIAVKKFVLLK